MNDARRVRAMRHRKAAARVLRPERRTMETVNVGRQPDVREEKRGQPGTASVRGRPPRLLRTGRIDGSRQASATYPASTVVSSGERQGETAWGLGVLR